MDMKIFGASEKALQLCEDRAVTLSSNVVNASTPNYKARDFDFYQAMQSANMAQYKLTQTNSKHLEPGNEIGGQQLKYRVPMQASLDGNTVDPDIERKNFIENALRYQVNLTFVKNDSDQLVKAFKGE
ncbi:MAG: flagellar basal body rod protein FlgB [Gammaproteobacteria bacterium]